jgi:hypothetical protein
MRSSGITDGDALVGIGGGEVSVRMIIGVVLDVVMEQPVSRKTITAERIILFI